jgi:hypothetical protein
VIPMKNRACLRIISRINAPLRIIARRDYPGGRKLHLNDSERLLTLPFRELTVCLQQHTMKTVSHV